MRGLEAHQIAAPLLTASALVTIAVAAVAAVIVWEGANAALERRLVRLSRRS